MITNALDLEHVSAFVIASSPASSCFITTLLSSCSNRPKAKCSLDPTASVEVQLIATASKIAFAATHRLVLRKIRSLWSPLSAPTSGDLHTSRTSLRCSHASGESGIVLGSDWTSVTYRVFCGDDPDYWTHHNQSLRRYRRVTAGLLTEVRLLLIPVWWFSDLPWVGPTSIRLCQPRSVHMYQSNTCVMTPLLVFLHFSLFVVSTPTTHSSMNLMCANHAT